MHRSTITTSVVVLSALLASAILLAVSPESSEAQGQATLDEPIPAHSSFEEGPGLPEEDFPPYSQTVDNTSDENFEAPGWKASSAGTDIYGEDHRIWEDGADSAKYNFDIPAKDVYSVFAWWPVGDGASSAVEIEINTGNETKTETVDQSEDGGYWVPIGRYELEKGERNVVEISAGSGDEKVFADAVAVVRGVNGFPAEPKKIGDNSETEASGETMFSAAGSKKIPRRKLMKRAKSHLGKPYDYNHGKCSARARATDCSCLTKIVYRKWRKIPDHPGKQWYGVKKMSYKFGRKSRLKRGDLVFFDLNRNGRMNAHDAVAIYGGNGKVILASSYFGKVAWVDMQYLKNFKGGKRLRYR